MIESHHESAGDAAQIRLIAEQVAMATIIKFDSEHPRRKEADIPPLIKWLVGAIAGFGAAALIGLGFWLVTTVSQMQVTLGRMDERMTLGGVKDARFDDHERRLIRVERLVGDQQ